MRKRRDLLIQTMGWSKEQGALKSGERPPRSVDLRGRAGAVVRPRSQHVSDASSRAAAPR